MSEKNRYQDNTKASERSRPVKLLFLLSPFLMGLFYEWQACAASAVLLLFLVLYVKRSGGIVFPSASGVMASAVIVFSFLITSLWATDRGMALLGFVKFLPVFLFALVMAQLDRNERDGLRGCIPLCGFVMVVLSLVLGRIPGLERYFLVNGRLAGFFQYPNVFAAYLTAGLLLLIPRFTLSVSHTVIFFGLSLGIFLSGSRAAMAICAMAAAAELIVLRRSKQVKSLVILSVSTAALIVCVYVLTTESPMLLDRLFTAPRDSSTFQGRLLYYRDALPVVIKHPFGLGYLGYYFRQGEFQTGVYSVMFVHNELLQLLLDIGWIPAGFAVWAVAEAFRRSHDRTGAIALAALLLHSLLDYDLQFVAMDFVLVLFLELDGRHGGRKQRKTGLLSAVCGALALLSLWLGTDGALRYFGKPQAAVRLYKGNTLAQIELLSEADTVAELERISDEILARNRYAFPAWSAKAKAAFAEGNTKDMVACELRALAISRYNSEEYKEYAEMLEYCRELYEAAGDSDGAEYCRERLREIEDRKQAATDSVSALGWRIYDKPTL